jgi:hypothetical protein
LFFDLSDVICLALSNISSRNTVVIFINMEHDVSQKKSYSGHYEGLSLFPEVETDDPVGTGASFLAVKMTVG